MQTAYNPEAQVTNDKYSFAALFVDETGETHSLLQGVEVQRSHFLGRELDGTRIQQCKFTFLSLMDCTIRNARWIETELIQSDFACSRIVGGYFKQVNFSQCSFRKMVFEDCIFDECTFGFVEPPNKENGIQFEGCVFVNFDKKALYAFLNEERIVGCLFHEETIVGSSPTANPVSVEEKPVKTPSGAVESGVSSDAIRFKQLER